MRDDLNQVVGRRIRCQRRRSMPGELNPRRRLEFLDEMCESVSERLLRVTDTSRNRQRLRHQTARDERSQVLQYVPSKPRVALRGGLLEHGFHFLFALLLWQ